MKMHGWFFIAVAASEVQLPLSLSKKCGTATLFHFGVDGAESKQKGFQLTDSSDSFTRAARVLAKTKPSIRVGRLIKGS